jgi:transposase InsO family protein
LRLGTRTQVLALVRWAARYGIGPGAVAGSIGLAPRTLHDWIRLRAQGTLNGLPRGCRACVPTPQSQLQVEELLQECHGAIGMPSLKRLFPELPRTTLQQIRAQYIAAHDGSTELLTWSTPGTVWAADYTDVPCPIDGRFPHVLCVRDLASSFELLCWPVENADADNTLRALQCLSIAFGLPLVFKTDNGSHFIARTVLAFLEANQVAHLPSPPRTPRYNGSAEASHGALKARILHIAASRGHPGSWTCDDLEAARLLANRDARPQGPGGPSPDLLWQARPPIPSDLRRRFLDQLAQAKSQEARNLLDSDSTCSPGSVPGEGLGASQRAIVTRRATRRVLTEFGFLSSRRIAN